MATAGRVPAHRRVGTIKTGRSVTVTLQQQGNDRPSGAARAKCRHCRQGQVAAAGPRRCGAMARCMPLYFVAAAPQKGKVASRGPSCCKRKDIKAFKRSRGGRESSSLSPFVGRSNWQLSHQQRLDLLKGNQVREYVMREEGNQVTYHGQLRSTPPALPASTDSRTRRTL